MTDLIIKKGIIEIDKRSVYSFGFELLFSSIINGVLIFSLAIVMGLFYQTIFLILPFMIVRTKAGGYHAPTHLKCASCFIISYMLSIFIIKTVNYSNVFSLIVLLFSFSVIEIIGAIPHEKRVVNQLQFYKFKMQSRVRTLIITIVGIVGIIFWSNIFIFYCMGLFIAACSLLVALIIENKNTV